MRLEAGDYCLVECAKSTPENPLFALPGLSGSFTYSKAMKILKDMGLKIEEIGPIRGYTKRQVSIPSQLGRVQSVMRRTVEDDAWQR